MYLKLYIYISSVFCPRAGPSLKAQEPRLQFCRRQVFHRKLRNLDYSSAQRQVFHCKLRNQGCSSAKDRSSTQTQKPRLQFCPKAGPPLQT